jgi:RHS repeat-associated protein
MDLMMKVEFVSYRHDKKWVSRLVFVAAAFMVSLASGQVSTTHSPIPAYVDNAISSVLVAPEAEVGGKWHGNLTASGDSSAAQWAEEFDLQQNSDGSISGTRRTTALGGAVRFVWSVTGSLSGLDLVLNDETLLSQEGTTTPCKITIRGGVSADASTVTGTWTASGQSGCGGGAIYASRFGGESAKRLGSGVSCNSGEGASILGAGSGGAGGANADGSSCAEKMGVPQVGDPIDASTGNFFLEETDFEGGEWLTIRRFYNSGPGVASASLGFNWRHSFDRSLKIVGEPAIAIIVLRPDGGQSEFKKVGDEWVSVSKVDVLSDVTNSDGSLVGYRLFVGGQRHTEIYSIEGKLLTVDGQDGLGITLAYGPNGLLQSVTDRQGRAIRFSYQSSTGWLTGVTLPDGSSIRYTFDSSTANLRSVYLGAYLYRSYRYNETGAVGSTSLPHSVTSIHDARDAVYERVTYDALGRATSSGYANDVGRTSITYNADGSSNVTYPLGNTVRMSFHAADGVSRISELDGPCAPDCGQLWKSRKYDSQGRPSEFEDFSGQRTLFTYNAYALLEKTIEAAGTPSERSVTMAWDTVLRKPLRQTLRDSLGATIASQSWSYDSQGRVAARCDVEPALAESYTCSSSGVAPKGVRRWNYTFCAAADTERCPYVGALLTVTSPDGGVETFLYYLADDTAWRRGDIRSVTNAEGHVTTYAAYDGAGRPKRIIDPNGVITDFIYDKWGHVNYRTVHAQKDGMASSADARSSFSFDDNGLVTQAGDPDGVRLTYVYDVAHRLSTIKDADGNHLDVAYDASGNTLAATIIDRLGVIRRSETQTYDSLGRLRARSNGRSQTYWSASVGDAYDGRGKLTHAVDANGVHQRRYYDAIGRLASVVDNAEDAIGARRAETVYQYDARDGLIATSDPNGLPTIFSANGFGEVLESSSLDSGLSTVTRDVAGRVSSQTDARGVRVDFSYDMLGRRTSASYVDATANISWHYDEPDSLTGCTASHPLGRLTRVVEASGSTTYCYDFLGNVVSKTHAAGSLGSHAEFTYTPGSRLASVTYPDGAVLTYSRNYLGNVTSAQITSGGVSRKVLSNVTYLPFGPVSQYTLGEGQVLTRLYNADYDVTDITSNALSIHVARDADGRVVARGDAPGANPASETYTYDSLRRLTAVVGSDGGARSTYTYDAASDRLSKAGYGLSTGAYGYKPGSHWLSSIATDSRSYNPSGSTTDASMAGESWTYEYSGRGQLATIRRGSEVVGRYSYNGLGERISKEVDGTTTRFFYSRAGQILSESAGNDAEDTSRDYIWLDTLPIGVLDGTTLSFVHADEMEVPRAVTDANSGLLWSWTEEDNAFGERSPASISGYTLNLRFAGQYYDSESGLFYNVHRYYDPSTGRYLQSDPLGIAGGPNAYLYAFGIPGGFVDPFGLEGKPLSDSRWVALFKSMMLGKAVHRIIQADIDTSLKGDVQVKVEQRTYNIFNKNYGVVDLMLRSRGSDAWSIFEIKPLSQWDCESPGNIQQLNDYVQSLNDDGVKAVPGRWKDFFPNQNFRVVNIPTGVTLGGVRVDGSYIYGSPDNNGMIYYQTGDATYPMRPN